MADFSGMEKLEHIVDQVLRRLVLTSEVDRNVNMVRGGNMTIQQFDGWFAPIVRQELGKTLGIIRNKAVKAAREAGAGSASTAVSRRMYKHEYKANVNILGNKKAMFRKREYPEPTGGKSGIKRYRTVSGRTKKLYEYSGPDRAFVLRFLESGTDVRTANPSGPIGRGSRSTYGNRGSIGARSFFGKCDAEAKALSDAMGVQLVQYVERWLDQNFKK